MATTGLFHPTQEEQRRMGTQTNPLAPIQVPLPQSPSAMQTLQGALPTSLGLPTMGRMPSSVPSGVPPADGTNTFENWLAHMRSNPEAAFSFGRRIDKGLANSQKTAEALQGLLMSLVRQPRFEMFFRNVYDTGYFGVDLLRQLLRSGLLQEQAPQDFLTAILQGARAPNVPGGGGNGDGGGGGGGGEDGSGSSALSMIMKLLQQFGGSPVPFNIQGLDTLDPALRDAMTNRLLQTFQNPGFPQEILEGARNQIAGTAKLNLRDAATRRAEDFSGRGLFGSGLQYRDIASIEQAINRNRLAAENELNLANAQAALQSLGQAFQGTGELRSGDQRDVALSLQEALSRANIGLANRGQLTDLVSLLVSEELGRGDLDLRRLSLDIQRALQEWIQNLTLGQFAGGSGGSTGQNTLEDILRRLQNGEFNITPPGSFNPEIPASFF